MVVGKPDVLVDAIQSALNPLSVVQNFLAGDRFAPGDMQFDRGYVGPCFINNPDKQVAYLDDPLVLINNKKIRDSRSDANLVGSDEGEQAAPDYRGRRGRRSAGDASREFRTRHPGSCCGQGAGFWRSP
jgi:hypothetical protein